METAQCDVCSSTFAVNEIYKDSAGKMACSGCNDYPPVDHEPLLLNAGPSERGWHRMELAARCLRLYAWNEDGKTPFPVSEPLVKGSLLHIGLAHYYMRKKMEQDNDNPNRYLEPEAAVVALSNHEQSLTDDRNAKSLWKASVAVVLDAMEAYINFHKHCSWRVLEVEKEVRGKLKRPGGEPFLFTQRVDLIVEDVHKRVWFVDHKSCYRINSKTIRQHILSGQFLGYQMFGRGKYGKRFAGVIVNRVKLSTPYGFDRSVLEPAPDAVKRFAKNLGEVEEMTEKYAGRPPQEWPAAYSDQVCFGKYGKCGAFELCQWGKENE
tara:strand:- start:3655 stop:4620 length:966 start_codon:yes stop_codon:yes gene_type:complete